MARIFVTDINLNKNELQNARIQNLSTAPSSPVTGQIYYNTTDNTLYFWNGTSFISTSGSLEVIQDAINSTIVAGVGLDKTYDDSGNTYTLDIDSTVATLTGTQTLTNKTLTSPVVTGLDATSSAKGLASFDSTDFTVTAGAVTLNKDPVITLTGDVTGSGTMTNLGSVSIATTVQPNSVALGTDTTGDYVATIVGTANEVTVSPNSGGAPGIPPAVTIGLPDDVTITNNLTVGGNLTVSGTVTAVNTETTTLNDNIIVLNNNEAGTPSQNSGIEVERGTSTNVSILWNESSDQWTATNDGTNYHPLTRKFSSTIGNGTLTQIPVTHNLDARTVTVEVYDSATYNTVECDVVRTSSTVVTLGFTVAPAAGAYTVVIVG